MNGHAKFSCVGDSTTEEYQQLDALQRNRGHTNGRTTAHVTGKLDAVQLMSEIPENYVGCSAHLLVIPGASQAHLVACFRFVKESVKRGLVATLVVQRKQIARLEAVYSREELRRLGFTFEAIDDDTTFPDIVTASACLAVAIPPLIEKWISQKKAGLFKPTCMLADRFLPWTKEIADKLEIPRYVFNSNSAMWMRYMQVTHDFVISSWSEAMTRPDWREITLREIRKQKGLEFFQIHDIPHVFCPGDAFPDFMVATWKAAASAEGIIINSVSEMEVDVINGIKEGLKSGNGHKVPRLYCVGPVTNAVNFKNEKFVATDDAGTECFNWLDMQPDKSVLYVCLGSQVYLAPEQIFELALGLESSQQRFLWVILQGQDNFKSVREVLPTGFAERVAGRGKVLSGWVRQLEVLRHRSIFGFLSHCGWQSTTESLNCGVPLLAWPQDKEQHMNSRYVTEVLKVGLPVNETHEAELTVQEEFVRAILKFTVGEEGRMLSPAAWETKLLFDSAVAEGGSSCSNREEFVKSILQQKLPPIVHLN